MTVPSLDQFALRRELRALTPDEADWFRLMAAAAAAALREGRASTVASNVPEILDCCKRLAAHLGASIELIERGELVDVIIRPPPRGKALGPLHAQSTPAGITVSEINVKDMDAYKAWLPDVQKRIADHGGKYIAGGFNKTTSLTGDAPPNRGKFPRLHTPSKASSRNNKEGGAHQTPPVCDPGLRGVQVLPAAWRAGF